MRTPQDWLAAQVTERPDSFPPCGMAAPLAWIASIQADAVSSERERCAQICDASVEVARRGVEDWMRRGVREMAANAGIIMQVAEELAKDIRTIPAEKP